MHPSGFSIGSIQLPTDLALAPMSGVTNCAFRKLIRHENPDCLGLVVTEFISIEGLTRKNLRSLEMMRYEEYERPISIQIFGRDIERMVQSAKMIEDAGADIVDINSGCPVPKVVRRGGGCELMRQPEHMAKMLSAVRAAISIPLTLKIRSGWDEENTNALEIARIAQDCGVDMLAVHGRTRAALYRGVADWGIVDEVASKISIPVIGSGDVVDFESYKALRTENISGVMIGRGAMENPWVFSEIMARRDNREFQAPAATAIPPVIRRYRIYLEEQFPQKAVLGRLKQLCSQVTKRVRGATQARRAMCQSKSIEEFEEQLMRWEEFLHTSPKPYPEVSLAAHSKERLGQDTVGSRHGIDSLGDRP